MKDIQNCSGKKVSLLNDSDEPPVASPSMTSDSGPPSVASSPPITPMLSRSNSTDSTALQTPSPITPDFPRGHYCGLADPYRMPPQMAAVPPINPYYTAFKEVDPAYAIYAPGHYYPIMADPRMVAPPQAAAMNVKPKKNSYPCPLAAQHNCNDFFTTSGHAARHAKKHTGKKDAFCPECGKAFTRKDNMEQHRRTHQHGGRGKSADGVKKAKTPAKRPRLSPIQSSGTLPQTDDSLDTAYGGAVQPTHSIYGAPQPSNPYPSYPPPSYAPSTGSDSRLDTLAAVASREQRPVSAPGYPNGTTPSDGGNAPNRGMVPNGYLCPPVQPPTHQLPLRPRSPSGVLREPDDGDAED